MEQCSEEWRPVVGYEDIYLISNKGNLKSKARTIHYSNGKKEYRCEVLRKANISQGYRTFLLTDGKGGKRKCIKASRLVAMAFIPNPDNKPCVDHKDTNKQNDCVENLHWVTYSENNRNPITMTKYRKPGRYTHSKETRIKIGLAGLGRKTKSETIEKLREKALPVLMFAKNGEYIKEFRSISHACEILNLNVAHVNSCCNKKRKSTGGYMWRYKKDWDGNPLEHFVINKPRSRRKPHFSQEWYDKMKTNKDKYKKTVYVYDLNMNFVCQCSSTKEAASKFGTDSAGVSRVCNGKIKYSKGHIFSYERR